MVWTLKRGLWRLFGIFRHFVSLLPSPSNSGIAKAPGIVGFGSFHGLDPGLRENRVVVGAVWSELVSVVFPVKQGKYREIFQKLARDHGMELSECLGNCGLHSPGHP